MSSHWNANCWHFNKCSSDGRVLWIVTVMRTMKYIFIYFIQDPKQHPRYFVLRMFPCSQLSYKVCLLQTGSVKAGWYTRKLVRWPHKRCDQRCLPDSWHSELTLQNNPILATAVVFSPRPIFPISCLCTELLLLKWTGFSHQHIDIDQHTLIGHVSI